MTFAPPAEPLPTFGASLMGGVGVVPPPAGVTEPLPAVAVVVLPAVGVPVAAPAVGVTEPPPVVAVVVLPTVGVAVAAPAPLIVTVQVTYAPPPLAEPLH